MADDLREFVANYAAELNDLTFNSKAAINMLTMLAVENTGAASSIAAAIEKHILSCPPHYKLFAVYLMDSILKNCGRPYTTIFARNLPEIFFKVWDEAPEARAPLKRVLKFWTGYFPDQLLDVISQRIAHRERLESSGAESAGAGALPAAYQATNGDPRSLIQRPLVATAGDPRLAAPSQSSWQAPAQQSPPTSQLLSQLFPAEQSVPTYSTTIPNGTIQPAGLYGAQGLNGHSSLAPVPAPQTYPSYQTAPETGYTGYAATAPALLPGVAAAPVQPPVPVYSTGPAQYVQQPQPMYVKQEPPALAAYAYQQPPVSQQYPPAVVPQQQQQPYGGAPAAVRQPAAKADAAAQALLQPLDLLNSLLQSGIIGPAAAAEGGSRAPSRTPTPTVSSLLRPRTFNADRLKVLDQSVVADLQASSERLRPKHLDLMYLHRRREQSRAKASRQWYVDTDAWLSGATIAAVEPAFFGSAEGATEGAEQEEEQSAPRDDNQPCCAISGEPFETFWDAKHQEWRCKGAKRLSAEEAARYGLSEGAMVLVSCLGSPTEPAAANVLHPAAGGLASALAAEQGIAEALAAATEAAAEPEAGDRAGGGRDATAPRAANEDHAKDGWVTGVKRSAEEAEAASLEGGTVPGVAGHRLLRSHEKRIKLEPQ